jgi:hypothetical protein
LSGRGTEPLGGGRPALSPDMGWRRLLVAPLEGEGSPLDQTSYFSVEGSSPWWTKPVKGGFPAIMAIRRVQVEGFPTARIGELETSI